MGWLTRTSYLSFRPVPCSRRNVSPCYQKGPDTAESVATGPQSVKTAPSIKTETPTSAHKSETSGVKTGPSTRDTAESGASASKPSAASPAASLQGFLLSDSSPKSAEVGGGGGGASTLSSSRAPASFPPSTAGHTRQEDDDVKKEVNLDGALCAPRGYKPGAAPAPHKAAGKAKIEGAAATPASGLAARSTRVSGGAVGKQKLGDGDWGGVSEGMFRKRVSEDLKAMLRRCGGRCEMKWVKDVYERQNSAQFNLQGKKVSLAFDWSDVAGRPTRSRSMPYPMDRSK